MRAKVRAGAVIPARELVTISGATVHIPDPERLVHLQFRRFAGCPVCNLHLRSIVRRHDEITATGICEVVLFHAPADELRAHTADLPFAVVADPDKVTYAAFGVESAARSLLNPRAWAPIVRAVAYGLRDRRPLPATRPYGGRLGLPADFLIDSAGGVRAAKYGSHVYDQWSVDELLGLARSAGRAQLSAG